MDAIIKKLVRRKKENQRGVAAVEFAIIVLVFITLLFGIIEFGLLMYNQHIVTNAGREGARYGIVYRSERLNESDIKQVVDGYGEQYIVTFGNKTWDVEVPSACSGSGAPLSVTVDYSYDFLFFPWSRNISSTTTMRCE